MAEYFDFGFLKKYGRVFKVFDKQDSGNICFGVNDGIRDLFIKFAGGPTVAYKGKQTDAITALKNSIKTYESIKHKSLVKYIKSEEIGNGLAMIFEWANGACMGRSFPSSHERIMSLSIEDKLNIFEQITDFLIDINEQRYSSLRNFKSEWLRALKFWGMFA